MAYLGNLPSATSGASSSSGATGAGTDKVFVENEKYITTSYTIGSNSQSSCTISIATPAVITQTNSFLGGEEVFFLSSGALPTGIVAATTYFVLGTGLSTSAFTVAATRGGSALATSGTQSGAQTCGKAKSVSMVGPMTVATGATVTVPTGQRVFVS
jgi:hypothetical protein